MDKIKKIQEILNKEQDDSIDLKDFGLTEEELETIDDFGEIYSIEDFE